MKTESSFIVRWSQGSGEERQSWWVRGVPPDRYYGEITCNSPRLQKGTQGAFVGGDFAAVQQLIQDIRRICGVAAPTCHGDPNGLLALGARDKPEIVLRYSAGSEATDQSARLFLKIVDILRRYVASTMDSAKSA